MLLIIKMDNMNIKGSQDGRIILLHVNWNMNYEIAIFVHFSVRCRSLQCNFMLIIVMN